MVMPAALVSGPGRTPAPYGLFSVVAFTPPGDTRWAGAGIEFDVTPGCGPLAGIGFGDFCADPAAVAGLPRVFTHTPAVMGGEASPFGVYAAQQCSPIRGLAAARNLAEQRLTGGEERAVEHAFATGMLGNTPNLRGATALTTTAVPINVGIALLEEWLAAEYGAQGVLHMPRFVVAASPGSVKASGQTLRTVLGTPVAAGSGYDGSGPAGEAPEGVARWIYITPALIGYRGDIETTDFFDHSVNDQVVWSERDYLIGFEDCGTAAVLVAPDNATGVTLPARDPNPYLTVS